MAEIIEFLGWNDIQLTSRAYNALKRDGVNTIPELEAKTICELRDLRNVGRGTVQNIIDALKAYHFEGKDEHQQELVCEHDDQRCIAWLNGAGGH